MYKSFCLTRHVRHMSAICTLEMSVIRFCDAQTYLSSSSSSTILSKCRWSLCPSLASINQWQLRLFPLLWLLTDGGVGDSIRPTVALRIHPPQDTAGQIIISNTILSEYHYQLVTFDSNSCTNRRIVALGCSSVVALC